MGGFLPGAGGGPRGSGQLAGGEEGLAGGRVLATAPPGPSLALAAVGAAVDVVGLAALAGELAQPEGAAVVAGDAVHEVAEMVGADREVQDAQVGVVGGPPLGLDLD